MKAAGRRHLSVVAGLLAALLASLLLVAQADADARSDAVAQFKAAQADAAVPAGWTGSTDTCTVGSESQASLDATLDTVNILRDFAGIGPVTFSAEKNHRALATAMLMAAQNDLSHDPPPSWECWTDEGHFGASTSNLYLGDSGASAMVGFVNDAGIDSLGHRRWVLDPAALQMGSGSTGRSNALVVIPDQNEPRATVPADAVVGWPSGGLFPAPWIFEDWSVALGNSETQDSISVANASVSVKVDGKDAGVSGVRELDIGYGTGRTLAWRVALPQSIASGDHDIEVNVTGVTKDGAPYPVSYTVNAFDPGKAGGSGDGDDACAKAKAKLKKAKKKLKAAKESGKSSKVKKAQKKVKKAKAKKRKACA